MKTNTCKNCREALEGKFCHSCGEKVVEPNDFSLKTMAGQFVDGLFNIDSKGYQTFKNLLFKPGTLTSKYIAGVRKPFMKPIQVFFVTNVLFFLLLTQADILRIPAKYFFNSGRNLNIEAKMANSNLTALEVSQRYDNMSADLSKSLIILMVPILAMVLWFLYLKSHFLFGIHLIFAMHFLSFFFLCCLLAVPVSVFGNRSVQISIIGINFIYLYFAMHQVYQNPKLMTAIKSLILLFLFFALIVLYRTIISYISFYLI